MSLSILQSAERYLDIITKMDLTTKTNLITKTTITTQVRIDPAHAEDAVHGGVLTTCQDVVHIVSLDASALLLTSFLKGGTAHRDGALTGAVLKGAVHEDIVL